MSEVCRESSDALSPNIDEAIEALLDYQQADMEGVMVLTSRQAIHEVTDEIERLRSRLEEIEARQECARRGIDPDALCADGGIEAWMIVAQEMRR